MFNQFYYFPLLILTALIYWLLPNQKLRITLLSVISMLFIYLVDKNALIVVIGLTIFTYVIAMLMAKAINKKPLLVIGITGIVALLLFFKYNSSLTKTINSYIQFINTLPQFKLEHLIMPMGISYIVFKYLSYLIDVYRGTVTKGSFVNFVCYGSLFTIFSAGPIERYNKLKPQLETIATKFQSIYVNDAVIRISMGLFKKMVIADWLGFFVHPVWVNMSNYGTVRIALTIVGYSLQIYFDFSGYSDIAIGSSRLFGFTITENFNNPYLAKNIGDFWRRWHISLSSWIQDYLFTPLSKLYNIRAWMIYLVPPIAMTICGMWHGSDFHFVLWGFIHGIAIDVYQYTRKSKYKIVKLLRKSSLFCLTFVTLAWIVFHDAPNGGSLNLFQYVIILTLIPIILYLVQRFLMIASGITKFYNMRVAIVILIMTIALQCLINTEFIYMSF